MDRTLYNALLVVYNGLLEGSLDRYLMQPADSLARQVNFILESTQPQTYDPDALEAEEIEGWQGLDDYDGQPDEMTEWHDYDPDC